MGLCFSIISCNQSYNRPNLSVLSLQETYQQAENVALNWQSDAQLLSANFDIEFSASPEKISCSYTFLSATSHRYLLVFVKADEFGYHLETVEDGWPADRPVGRPIVVEELNLESKEALQQILENGGNTFFERYQLRNKDGFLDLFSLNLERLNKYNGEGLVIWTASFSIESPNATIHISIEDSTAELLKVIAFGEQEQEYWLKEVTVTRKLGIGQSENFFDIFDVQLDRIFEENNKRYTDFTITSSKIPWLSKGEETFGHVAENSEISFGDYMIRLIKIDNAWIELEIMPFERWYKPRPTD